MTRYLAECQLTGVPEKYLGIIVGRNPDSRKVIIRNKNIK